MHLGLLLELFATHWLIFTYRWRLLAEKNLATLSPVRQWMHCVVGSVFGADKTKWLVEMHAASATPLRQVHSARLRYRVSPGVISIALVLTAYMHNKHRLSRRAATAAVATPAEVDSRPRRPISLKPTSLRTPTSCIYDLRCCRGSEDKRIAIGMRDTDK